jgi:hypothetical protein
VPAGAHVPPRFGTREHPCLVRSTDFDYAEGPVATYLRSVTQTGYIREGTGTYQKKSLPPLESTYTEPRADEEVHEVDPESLENPRWASTVAGTSG